MTDISPEGTEILTHPNEVEKLPSNITIIEKPEAKYRIIYGFHPVTLPATTLGNSEGVALELLNDYSEDYLAESLMRNLHTLTQYKEIINDCQNKGKPIYFIDITDVETYKYLASGLTSLEGAIGMALIINLAKEIRSKDINRRKALKMIGGAISGTYFLTPGLNNLLSLGLQMPDNSNTKTVSKFLDKLREKTHPETEAVVLTLRNHLMAQKLKAVAQDVALHHPSIKPEVAIVLGGGHGGIEEALKETDAERVALVDKLMHLPQLDEQKKKMATIARLDFNKGSWRATMLKDPLLAPLESKAS